MKSSLDVCDRCAKALAIRETKHSRWLFVIFGVALILHVFDFIVIKQIQWDRGIDIREYYTPHADAYMRMEPMIGVGFLALAGAMWALERRARRKML